MPPKLNIERPPKVSVRIQNQRLALELGGLSSWPKNILRSDLVVGMVGGVRPGFGKNLDRILTFLKNRNKIRKTKDSRGLVMA